MKIKLKVIGTNPNTEALMGQTLEGNLVIKDQNSSGDVHWFEVGEKLYTLDIKSTRVWDDCMVFCGILIDNEGIGGRVALQVVQD